MKEVVSKLSEDQKKDIAVIKLIVNTCETSKENTKENLFGFIEKQRLSTQKQSTFLPGLRITLPSYSEYRRSDSARQMLNFRSWKHINTSTIVKSIILCKRKKGLRERQQNYKQH